MIRNRPGGAPVRKGVNRIATLVRRTWIVTVVAIPGSACSDAPLDLPPEGSIDLAAPWVTVEPEVVSLDAKALATAGDQAGQIARMRSLLVVREGKLAYERYYGGWTADTLADVRSVTKSVVSTLVGIALQEGHIQSLDQTVGELLPGPEFDLTSAHWLVTVRHLLTMTGGFFWNEVNTRGYADWITSGDHVGYILDRPFEDQPGSQFRYNSAATHLLGVIVEKATGRSLAAYADAVLFGPLGISERRWEALTSGYVNGGAGLDLRPRDLARFGQLFLQEGWSGGRSVVPSAWIDEATARWVPDLGGVGPISSTSYGFLWWLDPARGAYFAWGFAGQFVYVAPNLDLVVVATTDWRGVRGDIGFRPLQEAVMDIIVGRVVPAAR